ncbi:hypothetical protein Tco_0851143, partial [Tanacetum coccineum]
FMASKHLKVTNTFMGGGGSESQAYKTTSFIRILNRVSVTILIINDDNPDDDDYECENLTEEQLAFCDAFDIRLPSQTRC